MIEISPIPMKKRAAPKCGPGVGETSFKTSSVEPYGKRVFSFSACMCRELNRPIRYRRRSPFLFVHRLDRQREPPPLFLRPCLCGYDVDDNSSALPYEPKQRVRYGMFCGNTSAPEQRKQTNRSGKLLLQIK